MSKQNIVKIYEQNVTVKQVAQLIEKPNHHFQLSNLVGSSLSFIISECFKKAEKPFLFICTDKEEAAYYLNDFESLINDNDVLFYPGSYRRPYQIEEVVLEISFLPMVNFDNLGSSSTTRFLSSFWSRPMKISSDAIMIFVGFIRFQKDLVSFRKVEIENLETSDIYTINYVINSFKIKKYIFL